MKREWKGYLHLGITLLVLWLVTHYWASATVLAGSALSAGMPLVMGGVVAYVVNIPMAFFERVLFEGGWRDLALVRKVQSILLKRAKRLKKSQKPAHAMKEQRRGALQKIKRPVCMVLALGMVVLLLFWLINMILPELLGCVSLLFEKLPPALEKAVTDVYHLLEEQNLLPEFVKTPVPEQLQDTLRKAVDLVFQSFNGVMSLLIATTMSTISGVITVFISLIFSVYLLSGKETIGAQVNRLMALFLKAPLLARLRYLLQVLDHSFHSYIVGQSTEAVILGVMCMVGMLIFRFPYAVMIGTLVGFTALIPVAGAYIGAVVGAFMIFTVNPMQAVWFLVFLVVLQQLEGNLIFPRVVGSSIGLPGIWVLAAVTVFGGLFGIGGMVFGVPCTAAVYRLLRERSEKQRWDAKPKANDNACEEQ